MTFDLTQITIALIGLLATIITAVALPWIKTKIGVQRWEQLMRIVSVAVQAAEQMHPWKELGENKLAYATEQVELALKRQGLTFDESTIRSAIEAAVLELKAGLI